MTISLSCKKDGYVECRLCPNRCKLKEGEIGKCSVRKCDGDTIFLINYGELVSVAVNPVEKKPFAGYLPKTKTLSVGGVGCSLSCKFCENHIISQCERDIPHKNFSVGELVILAKDKGCRSICMTFNEPTISYEYLIDLSEACHNNDLKFIIKTNAYVSKEPWAEICRVTDAMNIDWKGCELRYKEVTGAKDFVIMDRIKEAYMSGVHLEISMPLYYSSVSEDSIMKICFLIESLDKNLPCHLLKVNPSYKFLRNNSIDNEGITFVEELLKSHLSNVYVE